ncbi:monovalent cation/H(+) antiporter subunit G [Arthrobacter sp. MMS18-M83]|uniref:monovalent cation/H(+) antiporter subunit G n=1 Tax=Arthrobacter sp. MMS18-M83 TaxID=2996261 RepID=UPI00227C5D40|nr:monovalent cation/H(+) antiporter subunit G [Arthrobacter sp. MMS18-M83]WAH95462.1 monovalent cation/H(+) antiporter subunit G [Arthrobacter sp. MMS18-M83]
MTPNATGVDAVIDAVTAVLLIVGALMSLGAAIGLLRFPDLMSRMHAATKPQVLGLFLVLAAIGLQLREWWVWPVLLVAWIFQLLTVPVSAHMVGRAGYRTKHLHPELLSADELEAVVLRAAGERAAEKAQEAGPDASQSRNGGHPGGIAGDSGPKGNGGASS